MLEAQDFTPIGSSDDTEAYVSLITLLRHLTSCFYRQGGGALETTMEIAHSRGKTIDITVRPKEDLYPFCIVWTPIPPITIFLPFVGHMGIADSRGVIYDFQGPYAVGEGNLAFGRTSRYLQLVKHADSEYAEEWDAAIRAANRVYEGGLFVSVDMGISIRWCSFIVEYFTRCDCAFPFSCT